MTGLHDFVLPAELEAGFPPEEQGIPRDRVRLMVGHRITNEIQDDLFASLAFHLRAGDVLVINNSATIPAALSATTISGEEVLIHLSTRLASGRWLLEVRTPDGFGSIPHPPLQAQRLALADGGFVVLHDPQPGSARLWTASVEVPGDLVSYLSENGRPIRYRYSGADWGLDSYQTVYACQPGSAEMPSAGRPFTPELITALIAGGVAVVPLTLHSGVASIEVDEPPQPERVRVPAPTAAIVNALKADGGRVVAVGTTVTRALETAAGLDGRVHPFDGYTGLLIGGDRPLRVVDGLLTGWHEPRASHLEVVRAVAGSELTRRMYERAVAKGYLWHEFGDSCLILP
jgi:S-adenosylmethionine:tRNA ribosyltransferase-isomerase